MLTRDMPPSGSVSAVEEELSYNDSSVFFKCAFIADTLERS